MSYLRAWMSKCRHVLPLLAMALLLSIMLAQNAFTMESQEPWKRISNFDASTADKPVKIQIGNYNYRFPKNYFMGSERLDCNHAEMGFVAVLPQWEGKTKENYKTIFQTTGPNNPTVDILFFTPENRSESLVPNRWLEITLNTYKKMMVLIKSWN